MRRCTWIMVGLLALAMEARSDVVVAYDGSGPNTNVGNPLDSSAGVTFTTSGSSAGSGRWALQNFGFAVSTGGTAFTLTGATVSLFRDTVGDGVSYGYVGGQNVSLGAGVSVTNANAATINLALSGGVFGTVGTESSGLVAGGKYLLTVDNFVYGTGDGTDGYFRASDAASTGTWGAVASYFGTVPDGNGGFDFPSPGDVTGLELAGSGFSDNMYTQLSAVAVPEPGTLILGGIAAVSGGAGAWWRRRKNRKAAAEQAV